MGAQVYKQITAGLEIKNQKVNSKIEAAYIHYIERCSSLWTADELVEIWSGRYGKNLTDDDLTQILAYYQSAIGKKDVAATQAATIGFTQTMMVQGKKRINDAISAMTAEFKEAGAQ
jgi:hypothetical protein